MRPVFISHASKNFRLADDIRSRLEALNITCWIAPRNIPIGGSYGEQIASAIKDCCAVLLVLTEEANASKAVANELELAFRNQKVIVPLRVKPVEPADQLAFFVSNAQWVDAFHTPLKIRVLHIAEMIRAINNGQPTAPLPSEHKTLLGVADKYLEGLFRYKFVGILTSGTLLLLVTVISAIQSEKTTTLLREEKNLIETDPATFGLVTIQSVEDQGSRQSDIESNQLAANVYSNLKDPSKANIQWEAFWVGPAGQKVPLKTDQLETPKAQDVQRIELKIPRIATQITFCMTALHPTIAKPYIARWDFSISTTAAKDPEIKISRLRSPTLEPSVNPGCKPAI
jgi:hypothetical protein